MNQICLAMAIPGYSILQTQQAYISDYQRKWLKLWGL